MNYVFKKMHFKKSLTSKILDRQKNFNASFGFKANCLKKYFNEISERNNLP